MEPEIEVEGYDGRPFPDFEMEEDGRLVAATDDEFMDVDSLLIDNECEIHIVADDGQAVGYFSNEGSSTGFLPLGCSEGLLQSENIEFNQDAFGTRVEYFEEMLEQVKEEERLCLPCGSPDYSSAFVIVENHSSDWQEILPGTDEKVQYELPLQETASSMTSTLCESHIDQSGSSDDCLSLADKTSEGASSTPIIVSSQPENFKLEKELCLDNLTIKELHESFRATFGRETTVKDKSWLKRRIVMGLTNSCDSASKDNKLAKRKIEGSYRVHNGNGKDTSISHNGQLGDHHILCGRRSSNKGMDRNCKRDGHNTEERAAKRIRKPTKRYIEELSDVDFKESNRRLINSVKSCMLRQVPARDASSNKRTFVMRLDSLGGCGIQVPCVSRVRRGRPRKNFMTLLKFDPGDVGVAATLVKKALVQHRLHNESGNKVARRSFCQKFTDVRQNEAQISATDPGVMRHHMRLRQAGSSGNLDDNVVTVPTLKGGFRRKHHRAWTLAEVVKLVDGVSRYGPGRWSEIKRLAFASYSYRTSVDLKDKWRNLLKASFLQTSADKEMSSRKHASSMPIPAPILVRVRELASTHRQVKLQRCLSKVGGNTKKSVNERQSGYM